MCSQTITHCFSEYCFCWKMSQQYFGLLVVLLFLQGGIGVTGLAKLDELPDHLLPGLSDLPDPFLPGPFDVDHHHIARLSPQSPYSIVLQYYHHYQHHHHEITVQNLNPPERSLESWTTTWTFTLPTAPALFRFREDFFLSHSHTIFS